MKITILLEGRRNPEKNQKPSILASLKEMQAKLRKDGDFLDNGFTNGFVSFAELIKAGINPSPKDETTPAALYCYPLDYVVARMEKDEVESPAKSEIPYASNFPYLNVFSIKDKSKIWFIKDSVNYDQTRGIPHKPPTASEEKILEKLLNSPLKEYYNDRRGLYFGFILAVQKMLADQSDADRKFASARSARMYTIWLRKLGIDCVFDAGFGEIAQSEPVQAMITSSIAITHKKTIVNKSNVPGYTRIKYAKHGKNLDLPNKHATFSTANTIIKNVYAILDHDLIQDHMSEQDLFTIVNDYFQNLDPADEFSQGDAKTVVQQIVAHGVGSAYFDEHATDFADNIKQLKYLDKVFSVFKTCAKMYNDRFGQFFDLSEIQSDIIHIKQVTKFYQFLNIKIKSEKFMKLMAIVRRSKNLTEVEQSLSALIKFLMPHLDRSEIFDMVSRLKITVGKAVDSGTQFELHRITNLIVINRNSVGLLTKLFSELQVKYVE